MANYQVKHFKKDCISCGACAAISPTFWEMDEEGLAQLKGSNEKGDHWELDISESDKNENQEAADVCPVQIIKVEKSD
jgi:ferredoxin